MPWYDLSSLRERPDIDSALTRLSPSEFKTATDALNDAGASMALFLRTCGPILPEGIAQPVVRIAHTTIRTQVALGVHRVVMASVLGTEPCPLTEAMRTASHDFEQRAVRLAISRLSLLNSAIDVDIEKPYALHRLLVQLAQQPRWLEVAGELADRKGAMELALDGLCRHPVALATQMRALLSTDSSEDVPDAVRAAIWVLTLRGYGHRLGIEEKTIGYSDHSLVA